MKLKSNSTQTITTILSSSPACARERENSKKHICMEMLLHSLVVTGFSNVMLVMFGSQVIKNVWLLHFFQARKIVEKKCRMWMKTKEKKLERTKKKIRKKIEIADVWFSNINFFGGEVLVTTERFLCLTLTFKRIRQKKSLSFSFLFFTWNKRKIIRENDLTRWQI